MKKLLLCCVVGLGMLLGGATVPLVQFKQVSQLDENLTLTPDKRGYRLNRGKEGLSVTFLDHRKEKTSGWPYVGVKDGDLKVHDWRNFRYLLLSIRNHDQEISPTGTFVVRDRRGKLSTVQVWIRCNVKNEIAIPLENFQGEADFSQIRLLQLAMPRCPYEVTLELISADLSGEKKALDPNELVPRVFDIREEIVQRRRGVCPIGNVSLEIKDGTPYFSFRKYAYGMDKWPGLTLKSRLGDMLLDGDWSTKTHIYGEFEGVAGSIGGFGFSFTDDNRRNFWNGIGDVPLHSKVVMDRMIYDMGVDLSRVTQVIMGSCMPTADGTYRLHALRLEFRPESLYRPVATKLDALLKQQLNEEEQAAVKTMRAQLQQSYERVRGETARRGDIQTFISRCEASDKEADRILRVNQFRHLRENMKGYSYGVGLADSMVSVFIDEKGFVTSPARQAAVELARAEDESFQVVVVPFERALKNCQVTVSPLRHASGATLGVEAAVVGFAKTKRMTYHAEYTGWYPDFIITDQQKADIRPQEAVPFWIRIHADEKVPAGRYEATVTVSADGEKAYSFPLEATVWNFTVPKGAPLPTAFSFGAPHAKAYPQNTATGVARLHKNFAEQMASYRITYDRMYYGPYGTAEYISEIWKSLNDRGLLKSFCISHASPHPKYTKDRSNPNDPGVERLLRDLKTHMAKIGTWAKDGGFYDKAYFYGFDEWKVDAVTNRVFSFLKKNWPEIPIVTTARIDRADLPGLENIDVWVPTTRRYTTAPQLVSDLRKRGIKVWWYICNFPRPPQPSFMLEVPAIVPRLYMGAMTQKYRPEGFLYWSIISWRDRQVKSMVDYGPRTSWNPNTCQDDNEEGNLFIAGKRERILPSIRVENFRDGFEDLWYYRMLEQLIRERGDKVSPELLAQAKQAVTVSEDLVKEPDQHTLDPQLLRQTRRNLARLIEQMQH